MAVVFYYVDVLMAAVLAFLCLCFWRWKTKTVATNWPVVGMLPALLVNARRLHELAVEVLKGAGGSFEYKGPWFGGHDFLATSDPMNVHHILSKNFANYQKGAEFKRIFEPLGDVIFNVDSDVWLLQRKMVHSFIKQTKFDKLFEKVTWRKVAEGMIPILERASQRGVVVDMQDVFERFTFDSICLLILGYDPKCLSEEFAQVPCQKAFDDMWEAEIRRNLLPEPLWKLQKWLQIGSEKKLTKAMQIMDRFLYDCISSKRAQLNKRGNPVEDDATKEDMDFLTCHLQREAAAEQDGASSPSDQLLRDVAFGLLIAGRDTMSACLTWFFWLVARNPKVERKIIEEIKENLVEEGKQTWRFFSTAEQKKLVYLHGALCEALRLYPPVPIELKYPLHKDVLPSGHHVNQNSRIYFSFYTMGRMEEIWGKDCMEFNPERWISEEGQIVNIPSYKFVAFNAGPRTCLGKDLSFAQMKMVATSILWNYHIQVLQAHLVKPCLSIILRMKHGLKVRVVKRGSM